MLLTDLLNFFVSKHAALTHVLIRISLLLASLVFATVGLLLLLFNLESSLSSSVLGKCVRASIATLEALRSLIRLSRLNLVSVCQSLLPFLSVLASSEAAHSLNLADLIVDFIHICVLFQLVNSSNEGDLTHDNDFLKKVIDEALLHSLVLVRCLLLDERQRLQFVDRVLLTLKHQELERLKQVFRCGCGLAFRRFGYFLSNLLVFIVVLGLIFSWACLLGLYGCGAQSGLSCDNASTFHRLENVASCEDIAFDLVIAAS